MEAHIVKAEGHAPQFFTDRAESRRVAREIDGTAEPVTVPDTKKELVPWLNEFASATHRRASLKPDTVARIVAGIDQHIRPDAMPGEAFGRSMDAGSIMARSDNPGTDYDGIVEAIRNARGHMLRGFAGAVACAFEKLRGQG